MSVPATRKKTGTRIQRGANLPSGKRKTKRIRAAQSIHHENSSKDTQAGYAAASACRLGWLTAPSNARKTEANSAIGSSDLR